MLAARAVKLPSVSERQPKPTKASAALRLPLTVERMVHGGAALARTEVGAVALVTGALPGETVRADVRREKGVLIGAVVEVLSASPDRVPANVHPGLDYSFMSYERQLVEKRAVVADALSRARAQARRADDGLAAAPRLTPADVPAVVAAPAPWGYRNSVQPAAAAAGLGYRLPGSNEVLVLGADPSATSGVNAAWAQALSVRANRAAGIHELVIRANDAGEALVALVSNAPARKLIPLAHALVQTGVAGVVHAPYDPRGRFRSGAERLAGARFVLQGYGDVLLTMNAMSFVQPNPAAAAVLYRELARWAGQGASATELYAGGGAISFHLAPNFGRVVAVEIDRGAVTRGQRDAERLGFANVEFVRQDARSASIPAGTELLVVDPPRAGLSADTRAAAVASDAKRLIYVSCDAATWARDVADFEAKGFELTRFQPHDFYPQTHHVEILSELTRA